MLLLNNNENHTLLLNTNKIIYENLTAFSDFSLCDLEGSNAKLKFTSILNAYIS